MVRWWLALPGAPLAPVAVEMAVEVAFRLPVPHNFARIVPVIQVAVVVQVQKVPGRLAAQNAGRVFGELVVGTAATRKLARNMGGEWAGMAVALKQEKPVERVEKPGLACRYAPEIHAPDASLVHRKNTIGRILRQWTSTGPHHPETYRLHLVAQ